MQKVRSLDGDKKFLSKYCKEGRFVEKMQFHFSGSLYKWQAYDTLLNYTYKFCKFGTQTYGQGMKLILKMNWIASKHKAANSLIKIITCHIIVVTLLATLQGNHGLIAAD